MKHYIATHSFDLEHLIEAENQEAAKVEAESTLEGLIANNEPSFIINMILRSGKLESIEEDGED